MTAEYDLMPRSAIATGLVDYVLPPEAMPEALVRYVKQPYVSRVPAESTAEARGPEAEILKSILAAIRTRSKYDFRSYRKNMLMRRVQRRMGLNHIDSLKEYLEYLRENPGEVSALYRDLLIGVTGFFREPEAFQVVEQRVVPDLVERVGPDSPIRVWVPGCATGEEAYSIAMLFHERFAALCKPVMLQIFASDIDERSLETARAGIYPDSVVAAVSPERIKRFFVRTDDNHVQVNKQLRESIVFAPQNLISDAPFSKLDLVSCRNVLIYLEPSVQQKVISLFHFSLKENGYLLLGPSEWVGQAVHMFRPISKKWRVFRRLGASRHESLDLPVAGPLRNITMLPVPDSAARPRPGFADLMRNLLLEDFGPAAVLINEKYEILCFQGRATRYLEFPSGEPTRDLLSLARQGLRIKIRAACQKAMRDGETVTINDARVRRDGDYLRCAIVVRPVQDPRSSESLLLVTFHELPAVAGIPAQATQGSQVEPKEESHLVQQLEDELKATREDLQSTIEELESSNEELKASNEEVMSMNEELQSANEELETSKEELQSLNEEISTVNQQLQEKVNELDNANNDITNLLNSSDIATVFLDSEMRIKRFTPGISRLLNVRVTDLGRPITDFAARFHDESLFSDCRRVLRDLTRVEKEIWTDPAEQEPSRALGRNAPNQPNSSSQWYLRRVFPYRTEENRIEGVVITFVEITARKRGEAALAVTARSSAAQLRTLETLVNAVGAGLVVADATGRLIRLNEAAERILGTGTTSRPPQDWPKLYGWYLRDRKTLFPWDQFPLVRALNGEASENVEVFVKNDRQKTGSICLVTSAPLPAVEGRIGGAVSVFRDVTEAEHIRQSLHDSEDLLRAVVDTAADAIVTIDLHGTVQSFNKAAVRMFDYQLDEIVGKNVKTLIPPPWRDEHDEYLRRYGETREPRIIGTTRELRAQRRDGSTFPIELAVSEIPHLGRYTGIIRDISERKLMQRDLAEIVEEEQRRIGQDLHDGIGQELTGLGQLARALDERLTSAALATPAQLSDAHKQASRLASGLDRALFSLQAASRRLIPLQVEHLGLIAALKQLATETGATTNIECTFDCDPSIKNPSLPISTHLFRVAQEAVSNAVKHAHPQHIRIALKAEGPTLTLSVEDDGIGIDEASKRHGTGLRTMRNRAAMIGAEFRIGVGSDGRGTRIRCDLVANDQEPQR